MSELIKFILDFYAAVGNVGIFTTGLVLGIVLCLMVLIFVDALLDMLDVWHAWRHR